MSAVTDTIGLLQTLLRARLIAPMRPDRYLRMAAAMRREGMTPTAGFAAAAQRCDAFAAALQALPGGTPKLIGIMCRNHRGFVTALVAAHRVGADVLLLNTSFAGPALAEVVTRERVDAVIYDQEFTATVDRALAESPHSTRILGWAETPP